ncbi:alpha/beta hydrolase [Spiroplasma endosymbiont of Othius punctulatus]|uniref:alpha/beta hydrolase n=1 Tax=Spiroplasma endosymbiont of Othius punctulatus TaxID=3066289 RepID=UPI0030D1E3D7
MDENKDTIFDSGDTSDISTNELVQRQVQHSTIVNKTRKVLTKFYGVFVKHYSAKGRAKRKILKTSPQPYIDLEVYKYNNMVRKYYKRPELVISDPEHIKEFNILSFDGTKLNGLIYEPNPNSKKWIVLSHWFTGNKYWITFHAKVFTKLGYNVVAIDFRGHGKSEENVTTLGVNETHDYITAIRWLKKNRQIDELGLFGISMGAFIVNFTALKYSKELQETNLKFVISDCGYVSVSKLVWHFSKKATWFVSKKRKVELFDKFIKRMDRSSTIIDDEIMSYKDINLFRFIKNKAASDPDFKLFPTMFFHSADDKQTIHQETYEYVIKRSKYYKGHVDDQVKVFQSAPHTQSIRIHFKKYNELIIDFLERLDLLTEEQKILASETREEWKLTTYDANDKRDVKSKLLE